ncbi:MAG TPA: glycine--tRNA ligase [Tepidisphaeraceae bacterium]|jgi:glycyl-tRNA synthetase|nr:glycine--tRNA ligase [Tepidisphaeraceae bacterium]
MPDAAAPNVNVMEQIVSLCKRRGFVYQASEIYGGLRGFWDYGPLGVLLKNNIRDWWWRNMVECPPIGPDGHPVEIVGLDSSIIQHPKTWDASGHTATFADPMRKCTKCGHILRADHYWDILATQSKWFAELLTATENFTKTDPDTLIRWVKNKARKSAPNLAAISQAAVEAPAGADAKAVVHALAANTEPCILCGAPLGEPEQFNLMMISYAGLQQTQENLVYLRPETAQGIFLDYKNILDTTRVKVPFGVAQVGKSFRNEVTPRNFIFRSREFEQMEMEFFCPPDQSLEWFEFWKQERMKWWLSLGVKQENLVFRDHATDELSHYSKATTDIEYKYPFTAPEFGELEGVAHRGDYDLTQHQKHSGQKLDFFDQELQLKLKEQGVAADEIKSRSRYVPHVIEPASGLTRAVLVLLCESYRHEKGRQGAEEYFSFKPRFAPVKCGVFPLVNKEGMPEVAEKLYLDLRQSFTCEYDAKQSIGKRYARMDEIGTPYCLTIDGDTLASQTVTVRERDTMTQERVSIDKIKSYLLERLER